MNVTAHFFSFPGINGQEISLSAFIGKVLLIVNTASQCGFTPQFKDLEMLHQTYKERGLIVIGIPSNDFGHQDPGSNQEICDFAVKNFLVTFLMTEKLVIKGIDAHPFFKWINQEVGLWGKPRWNFYKYLIGKDGKLIDWFLPTTAPTSLKIIKTIEKELLK
jgi:glutathione peroxidase